MLLCRFQNGKKAAKQQLNAMTKLRRLGGGRVPAVLLSVHSTGKGGRLGGAALHTNVGSLPRYGDFPQSNT